MRLEGEEAIDLVHAALDGGIRLLDTADVYGSDPEDVGANERLVARALASWGGNRNEVVLATKCGLVRRGREWIPDGRAKHVRAACERSLASLGVESIDLYQLHAPDPRVPFSTTLRALAALEREGTVKRVGLSNVRLEELEEATGIVPVASVQVALSPLDLTPLKNGVAEYCVRHGITILAHSPLGGHRARHRIEKEAALGRVAERRSATVSEVALAWLRSLHPGVIPLPGASRRASLDSILRAARLELSAEDREELDRAYPAARAVGAPRGVRSEEPAGDGEIVLFVGYPGAGKSSLAERWLERGYVRLNRDVEGRSLSALLPELDSILARGERRVVLDNTYPRRASRFDVLELARKHRVPATCVWLQTSLEDAQVNAVERMIARYGKLLSPEEIASASKKDENTFSPDAQLRYRRHLEPPRPEEGFFAIETIPFTRRPRPERAGRGLFFEYDGVVRKTRSGAARPSRPDDIEVLPNRREVLARYAGEGFRLLGVSHQPEIPEERVRECFERTNAMLGLEIEAHFCPHPGGPAVCWCRKPLPGLGVLLIEKHALEPARSLIVAASPADRGFALRLGIPTIEVEELFRD
jgi:aryl-alcohol dehydrogenase-like predicted oxidoreductase/histidinol phosphatase-like enzyme